MHDLRWDQEAEDAATHARLKATVRVRVLTPEQLRTVEMPNLRSPEARSLDGETRDLCPYAERNDERLARIEEAIECIADKVTVLMRRGRRGEAGPVWEMQGRALAELGVDVAALWKRYGGVE